MLKNLSNRTFALLFLCVIMLTHTARTGAFALEGSISGTVISNRAEITYTDDLGTTYAAVSQTVTVTVMAVSSLVVTPDETESSARVGPNERITRVFRVCNTGNTVDAYTITRAEVNVRSEERRVGKECR